MKRIDLYLDKPINILGKNGSCYPDTTHINTMTSGDEYIEDGSGSILYFRDMDIIMIANVQNIVEQNT